MRIGIDLRPLQSGHRFRGIGTYTRQLIEHIAKVDQRNNYIFFLDKGKISPGFSLVDNFKYKLAYFPVSGDSSFSRRFYQQAVVPYFIRREKVDIMHFTDFDIPYFKPAKSVVTVHDLIPFKFPQFYPSASSIYRFKKYAIRYYDKILVYSNIPTKYDLMHYLKVAEEKIEVIHLAPAEEFYKVEDSFLIQKTKEKYSHGRDYFLYAGGFEPRKNVGMLLEAFSLFLKQSAKDFNLLIAGKEDVYTEKFIQQSQKLNIASRVKFLGYIPSGGELNLIYNSCFCFVTPTLYESFCFPLTEAMAAGVPVICFSTGSNPVIVAGNGLMIDDVCAFALAKAMVDIQDEKLRNFYIQKSLARAKEFSWKDTAKKTVAVYEGLA